MIPIVMVDDSREDLQLAERVFREANIVNPVHALNSGAECMNLLQRHYSPEVATKPPAALILLDLSMPVMDGVQTIAAINQRVFTPTPWIVMLSGQADVKLVRDGYQLGAKTFFAKPLRKQDVDEFLTNNERFINMVMRASGYELHWA